MLKNPKHELFAQELIKQGGQQAKAYLAVYPNSTLDSARHSSSVLLTKVDIRLRVSELLEAQGLGVAELVGKIKELTEAKKIVMVNRCARYEPDNSVILEAIKVALRIHGLIGNKSDIIGVYLSPEQLAQLGKEQKVLNDEKY